MTKYSRPTRHRRRRRFYCLGQVLTPIAANWRRKDFLSPSKIDSYWALCDLTSLDENGGRKRRRLCQCRAIFLGDSYALLDLQAKRGNNW